jgi:hypothetical protein
MLHFTPDLLLDYSCFNLLLVILMPVTFSSAALWEEGVQLVALPTQSLITLLCMAALTMLSCSFLSKAL